MGNIGDTLKNTAQNIAEKPRTNRAYAFIRRMGDDGGEAVELRHRVTWRCLEEGGTKCGRKPNTDQRSVLTNHVFRKYIILKTGFMF